MLFQVITFEKVKVTNNESDNTGQVRKCNFHKFSSFSTFHTLKLFKQIKTPEGQHLMSKSPKSTVDDTFQDEIEIRAESAVFMVSF